MRPHIRLLSILAMICGILALLQLSGCASWRAYQVPAEKISGIQFKDKADAVKVLSQFKHVSDTFGEQAATRFTVEEGQQFAVAEVDGETRSARNIYGPYFPTMAFYDGHFEYRDFERTVESVVLSSAVISMGAGGMQGRFTPKAGSPEVKVRAYVIKPAIQKIRYDEIKSIWITGKAQMNRASRARCTGDYSIGFHKSFTEDWVVVITEDVFNAYLKAILTLFPNAKLKTYDHSHTLSF